MQQKDDIIELFAEKDEKDKKEEDDFEDIRKIIKFVEDLWEEDETSKKKDLEEYF